jgi:hypothetical protein
MSDPLAELRRHPQALVGLEATLEHFRSTSGLAAEVGYLEGLTAGLAAALEEPRRAAEQALQAITATLEEATATLSGPLVIFGKECEQAAETLRRGLEQRIHRLGADRLEDEELPDTRHSITAYRATLTARMIARRALQARRHSLHPSSTTEERALHDARHRALISAAWAAYRAAVIAAEAGDTETALRHLQAVNRLTSALRAGLEENAHREHRHRPRRALAPPGRRCVARHLSAQAPPRALVCHVPAQVAHGSESPPG